MYIVYQEITPDGECFAVGSYTTLAAAWAAAPLIVSTGATYHIEFDVGATASILDGSTLP